MEPLPEKLEAINNLAPARNIDEACHILRLLGYYRSFIPAFANITLPITNLLKKNTPFIWSSNCQQALDYLKEIFCNKPLLQFPDPNKPYILYTDASNNAYSGILCQPVNSGQDIRPVAYFSGTFTVQNKSWCATEKEVYATLKVCSVLITTYEVQSVLCCNYKPLEPFLSRGMKIAKLDRWVMLLQEYDITFVHIKGKDNILPNAISRLHTLDIYEKTTETQPSPAVQMPITQQEDTINLIQHIDSTPLPQSLNMNSTTLQTLQKQDKFCKHEALKLHLGTNSSFYLNTKGVLKCTMVINNLEVITIVVLLTLNNTLLHEFHNCRGHQGCARTLNTLKREFWWKGISNCITCSKNKWYGELFSV